MEEKPPGQEGAMQRTANDSPSANGSGAIKDMNLLDTASAPLKTIGWLHPALIRYVGMPLNAPSKLWLADPFQLLCALQIGTGSVCTSWCIFHGAFIPI